MATARSLKRSGPERDRYSGSPELRARVRDWIEREIAYIPNEDFDTAGFETRWSRNRPKSLDRPIETNPEPGVTFVKGLVDAPLLTPDEERYLFTWMNYLRHRAEQARRCLSLNSPDPRLLDRLEADLLESQQVRNQIVRSNLRLVVSVARQLTPSLELMSELIAEATVPLIRAVELFNIARGNRFSTYATWAVRNHMRRCLKRRQTGDRGAVVPQECLESLPDRDTNPDEQVRQHDERCQLVQELLSQLDERDRVVVSARFGLDGQPQGQSLQEIASRVGLSKERVRQIVLAAVERLQEIARTTELAP